MRVYHFIKREYGLENLRLRRLKIATINELNDPFELEIASADPQERFVFTSAKERMAASFGMLCFSRCWKNPVQWSHYADRHRGMCLGFDVPDSNLNCVSYKAKCSEIDLAALTAGGNDAVDILRPLLYTKFSHWRYEKEVRMWIKLDQRARNGGLYFFPFSRDLELKEIIVGLKYNITQNDVHKALGDNGSCVLVYTTQMASRSFNVVRTLHSGK